MYHRATFLNKDSALFLSKFLGISNYESTAYDLNFFLRRSHDAPCIANEAGRGFLLDREMQRLWLTSMKIGGICGFCNCRAWEFPFQALYLCQ